MVDVVTAATVAASAASSAASGASGFGQVAVASLGDADGFNKVWGVLIGAGVTIAVAALTTLVTTIVQLGSANRQRKHERDMAEADSADAAQQAADRLSMTDVTSQRKASAKVAQMRQVWINDLRTDAAAYLAIWQDIAYRWAGIIGAPNERAFSSVTAETLHAPVAGMRQEANELRLRIEMRLNPGERAHKELQRLMTELEYTVDLFKRDRSAEPTDVILGKVQAAIQGIVAKQQDILKAEWNVVKRELGVKLASDEL